MKILFHKSPYKLRNINIVIEYLEGLSLKLCSYKYQLKYLTIRDIIRDYVDDLIIEKHILLKDYRKPQHIHIAKEYRAFLTRRLIIEDSTP